MFKVAILCGKQGLAMRGHRDDRIQWEDEDRGSNEGNFVQLVRFRAETDTDLADHLTKGPRYTSKTIQNELVRVIGVKICSDIIEEIKSAKFYSIIADEVTDAANKEEVIRYVHGGQIRELFVDFLEVERITGRVLGEMTCLQLICVASATMGLLTCQEPGWELNQLYRKLLPRPCISTVRLTV